MNGDGRVDLFIEKLASNKYYPEVHLSSGSAFAIDTTWSLPAMTVNPRGRIVDVDGDMLADYVFAGEKDSIRPAVTLAIAKRKGTNATALAHAVERKLDAMKGVVIPSDVAVTITRNYGETAAEKSDELLFHMLLAVISVVSVQ